MTLKNIVKYYLIWQILIIFVVSVAIKSVPLRVSDIYLGGGITKYLSNPLLYFRSNFDGVHYILISTHGYSYGQQAFFPFYPKLISLFKKYINDPVITGSLISSIAFLVGLIYFYKLVLIDNDKMTAKWSIISLLIFPTSFYFSTVYTEGILFLMVILTFYLTRTKKYLAASIIASLAGYTKFVGIFLFPALVIELYFQNKEKNYKNLLWSLSPLLIAPIGLLTYMFYLHSTTGDYFAFYHLQTVFNQQRSLEIILPYQVFWRYLKMIFTVNSSDPLYLTIMLEFIIGILFFVLSIISLFKQKISYAVFNLFAFLIPTFTGVLTSLPRYVLLCFPAFILIAKYLIQYPKYRKHYIFINLILAIIFISLFSRGYWVA